MGKTKHRRNFDRGEVLFEGNRGDPRISRSRLAV